MFSAAGKSAVASGYFLTNSLRLRSSATAYLNRTFATPTSTSTWTFSTWVKRGDLAPTNAGTILASRPSGTTTAIYFNTTGNLVFWNNEAVAATSTGIFRDASAWYHLVVSSDGTTTTAYINNETVLTWAGDLSLINNAGTHYIGHAATTGTRNFDGYFAETYFVDGQALTPSSFGATNADTGVWRPKAYTGTYGTNGFYLKFSDIATTSGSNAGLGKDNSGNGNYWNTNNISVTAGATYDAMTDVPTLTSATVANYATLNPLDINTSAKPTFSNANLQITSGASGSLDYATNSTIGVTTGKYYCECQVISGTRVGVGVTNYPIQSSSWVSNNIQYVSGTGSVYKNGSPVGTFASWTTGDVIGVALDADAQTVSYYKNNTLITTVTSIGYTGTTMWFSLDTWSSSAGTMNFGQRPFTYTPPSGYVALNTYNLPDSTIKKGNKYMDATLYTGNGANRSITNAASFRPDFVWGQARSAAYGSWLFDSVRGATKQISSFSTNAESTQSTMLTAFNSDGFSMGTDTAGNESATTFVGWQWQAGQGTNVTNTNGSITSTVSVNTTAGFSVVTYTGNSTSGATIGHGLGVAPKMIIVKTRNAVDNWAVYHSSTGATQYLQLNNTNASASSITLWNDTSPTSTVFSVGTNNDVNDSARTYVAYCWAEIEGFSKFGSYTGNGSTDGTFVYLGFRPKFIIIKSSSVATTEWEMFDTSRNTGNLVNLQLMAHSSAAEATTINAAIDLLSNGLKIRSTGTHVNSSSGTYIYMAFAENPFKNALAR